MKKFSLLLWSEVSFLLLRMTLKLSAGGGWEFQLPGCHHHTASENITSYTPTPSPSEGLTGDLFLEIFSEEREKMIYCLNCLAGISREYFVVWAASPLNIVQQGETGLAKTQLN